MSGTSRAGKERERREGDMYHQSYPTPSMPPLITRPRPPGDSMLAYSERMRQISRVRADPLAGEPDSPPQTILEIQARHIPKTGPGHLRQGNMKPPPRRPLSFNELIGRKDKKDDASTTGDDTKRPDRCKSEPVVMPSISRDKEKEGKRIRINFVSTADLFDLVDFSLRSKRHDNVHLARVEDTLRIINREANFFRSMSSRRRIKPDSEKDVDGATLMVRGTSGPGESSRHSREASDSKEDERVRKDIQSHLDPYDSDDEEDGIESPVDLDFDCMQDKRNLLLQPPKLHHRPKRAKRMKLHKSLLSAIPEDEHTQRPDLRSARVPDNGVRMPVIPTSSSLTAIKGTRQPEALTFPDSGMKKSTDRMDNNTLKTSRVEASSHHAQPIHHQDNRTSKTGRPRRHVVSAENGPRSLPARSEYIDHPHSVKVDHSPKKESARRAVSGFHTSSLTGRSVLLEDQDTRHKKIRKIIFLRDLPERSSYGS